MTGAALAARPYVPEDERIVWISVLVVLAVAAVLLFLYQRGRRR
ncbi:hypothetical protein [Streptomyces sp. NPDC060194]